MVDANRNRRRSSGEASWITDLRAQGVNVEEFLRSTTSGSLSPSPPPPPPPPPPDDVNAFDNNGIPPATVVVQSDDSGREERRRRERPSELSDEIKGRFSGFLDKAYVFDEAVGDYVVASLEEQKEERWKREVEEDSKNYDPRGTTEEKIRQNKEWAVKMARRRAAEAGYDISTGSGCKRDDDDDGDNHRDRPPERPVYPKVRPPPPRPIPPIDDEDFESAEPSLTPRDIGIVPPDLPYPLKDLIPILPRVGASRGGIAVGTVHRTRRDFDPESMIVACINERCGLDLVCRRSASLVRCDICKSVSPACPVAEEVGGAVGESDLAYNDVTERTKDTANTCDSSFTTARAVRGPGKRRSSS